MKLQEIQQALEALGVFKAIRRSSRMGPEGPRGLQGPKGDKGSGGSNTETINEIPIGNLDGINKVFSTINNFTADSTKLYVNGLRQKINSSYNETGTDQIRFSEAPLDGDELIIDYINA